MALHAILTVNGKKAGKATCFVIGYSHEMGEAGEAAGDKYRHRPFVIQKNVDPASPLLHQFQTEADEITCTLKCNRVPQIRDVGASEQHFTITLSEARIVSIRTIMMNNRVQSYTPLPIMEEVAFAYKKIMWTYMSKDGADGAGAEDVIPAPDKLDEWAKGVLVNSFKKHTDTMLAALKDQTKALYDELLGPKKPPAP